MTSHLSHDSMKFRLATLVVLLSTNLAVAGDDDDYTHACKSVDTPSYAYNPRTKSLHKDGENKPIKFKVKKRLNLRNLQGNCVSGKERFRFRDKTYGLTLQVKNSGKDIQLRFVCNQSRYLTPKGRTCDRVVYKEKWTAPQRFHERYR